MMSHDLSHGDEKELWRIVREANGDSRASALLELSQIELNRKNYRDALAMCFEAKSIFLEQPMAFDRTGLIDALIQVSIIYEFLGECEIAEESLIDATELSRKIGDFERYGQLLRALGRRYFDHGKWSESISSHSEALVGLDEGFDPCAIGIDYLNIGMAYQRKEDYINSIEFELLALGHFKGFDPNGYWTANTYLEMAASYLGLEEPDRVIEYSQLALDWFEIEESYQKTWILKYFLGASYGLKGEYSRAIGLILDSRSIALKYSENRHSALIDIDSELGKLHLATGNVEVGEEFIRRSESLKIILSHGRRQCTALQ